MSKIEFYNLKQQYADQKQQLDEAISRVAASGQCFANEEVINFENAVSEIYQGANVVACNSGTSALTIALKNLRLPKNSLVAIPAMTYIATANAVLAAGLFPICVDVDNSWLMDINDLEQQVALTERFSAVIVVDLYGQGVNLKKFKEFCDSKHLKLIVDAAQSFYMYYGNYNQTDFADILALSFNPLKNLGALGNAGAVVSSKYSKESMYQWTVQGRLNDNFVPYGDNNRIDAIQAAVLNVKLSLFERNMLRKTEISWYYREQLGNLVPMPIKNNITTHMNYVFVIAPQQADRIRAALKDADIQFACHYDKPLHHYDQFASYSDMCPNASRTAGKCISLPNHWHLTDNEVERVVQTVKSAL